MERTEVVTCKTNSCSGRVSDKSFMVNLPHEKFYFFQKLPLPHQGPEVISTISSLVREILISRFNRESSIFRSSPRETDRKVVTRWAHSRDNANNVKGKDSLPPACVPPPVPQYMISHRFVFIY
ncbi:hypothetical protein QN277_013621 [Acacia crassicarpa]|uniref:Uncharacterized protein n=1 Tax=Acacia crassicarpa TaxID=499986 RepID=A0AAE1N2S8_9FABA|nr:hypothetical protein QN277_013621 [Acacia crassicarpa]